MLEKLGVRTDLAANGREAVDMAEVMPYALIRMDCQMPVLDGYDAAIEIRLREGARRHVAIAAMTAKAMAAGMDGHIAKPVKVENLFNALMKWIPERNPTEAAKPPGDELDLHASVSP
jgi:two-component system sensor histidine kinase/response regulator